jgi:hypothetical protein
MDGFFSATNVYAFSIAVSPPHNTYRSQNYYSTQQHRRLACKIGPILHQPHDTSTAENHRCGSAQGLLVTMRHPPQRFVFNLNTGPCAVIRDNDRRGLMLVSALRDQSYTRYAVAPSTLRISNLELVR